MNTPKKIGSMTAIIAGIIMMAVALYMDFTKSNNSMRGALLIIGLVMVIVGVYFFPTAKHRMVINVLFLLPLVFTFLVTVILPFVCGIFYSMTDWNGVTYKQFVGLDNYITMFKSSDYIYSFVITFLFTVFNMIAVNVVGFALALI